MPTRHKGPAREVRALDAFIKLSRAGDRLFSRLSQRLAEHGLTMGQLGVLEALFHLGPLHQCELGRKLLRSNANMTTVIDNLEKERLIRRERSEEDRRFVRVSLTPAGKRVIEKVFPQHAAAIAEGLSALSLREQEELGRLCKKLGLALGD